MDIKASLPHHVLGTLTTRCKIISQMPKAVQDKLIPCLKYCIVEPGTRITSQGKKGDKMFIIFSGSCCAYAVASAFVEKEDQIDLPSMGEPLELPEIFPPCSESHEKSSQQVIDEHWDKMTLVETLLEGEGFGESALVGKRREYSYTVLAAVHVELLILESSPFQRIFGDIQPVRLPWFSERYRSILKRCPRKVLLSLSYVTIATATTQIVLRGSNGAVGNWNLKTTFALARQLSCSCFLLLGQVMNGPAMILNILWMS